MYCTPGPAAVAVYEARRDETSDAEQLMGGSHAARGIWSEEGKDRATNCRAAWNTWDVARLLPIALHAAASCADIV